VAATAMSSAALDPDEQPGFLGIPNITWKKIVPLGFMFFAILFNYTILRDTKVQGVLPL
jgi:ATP:ADP antiporter, AAA family